MTFKKLTEVLDHSAVNFMVGCTLLILSRHFHRKYGLYSDSFITSSSSSEKNKMLYRGAKSDSSPPFFLKYLFPNINMLIFSTTSAKSIMMSVDTYFSFQLSSRFHNASRPSSYGMLEYNARTSIVHKIMRSGNVGRERSFFKNSLVSLI